MLVLVHLERPRLSRARRLPRRRRARARVASLRLGGTFERLSSFIRGNRGGAPARHHQGRRDRGPRERADGQGRSDHRQRRRRRRQRRYRCARREPGRHAPVQKVAGSPPASAHGVADLKAHARLAAAQSQPAKEAAAAPRAGARRGAADAGREVTDEITLTLPREREFHGVAHLVSAASPRGST